jgi:putative Ca2+/H+ antiporter (TMEM165/GDT1 family)
VDALLPPFIAALLAEIGDKTQLLALLLAAHFGRKGAVLAGIAIAAMANALLSSFAGALLADMINFRAITLLLALALLFAGVGALLPQRAPRLITPAWLGAFPASAFAFAVVEFGDKTQFLTTTLAARSQNPLLTAAGAALGVILASAGALILGNDFKKPRPGTLRRAVAILFLLLASWAALHALRIL